MEILGTLFGSPAKVKIMRLFLFNPEKTFDLSEIADRAKVTQSLAKREVSSIHKSNLIKERIFVKTTERNVKGKKVQMKRKTCGYTINETFPYLMTLKNLMLNTKSLEGSKIVERLSRTGKLKLVLVSGVFINDPESRVDMLVVGDKMSRASINNAVKHIESEIGKELNYAFFEMEDFKYRLGMYDKLIRDILDYPHKVLLDRINIK